MKDFYYILGTDSDCTLLEIKEAYKKLAKKFHPDLNQGDKYFESHFKEIQEAYETLSDPRKRSQYDKALKDFKASPSGGEQRKQYSYSKQAANHQYKYKSATKPLKRGPGVGMSIVLIVVALIVGAYTVEWLTSSKKKTIVAATPDNVAVVKTHKHHKKKHHFSSTTDSNQSDANNKVANVPVNPLPVKPILIKPGAIKPAINNTTPVSNKIPNSGGASYTTYIHPNATGVVNMRKSDTYSSDVIERIPANSRVLVMEKGNMYYKVSYNNAIGYVPKWAVEMK